MDLKAEMKRISFFSHFERKKNFSVRVFPSIEDMVDDEANKNGFTRSEFVSAAILRLVDSYMDDDKKEAQHKFQTDCLEKWEGLKALANAYNVKNDDVL